MKASLPTQLYLEQLRRWPNSGRHILAHADAESVIVYQAYRASIARFAIANGFFGGPEFSLTRMSWIKPNFLWMMYRSAWATAEGQEIVLGLRLSRDFFEHILRAAVASSYGVGSTETRDQWEARVAGSDVRLQWDPDHDPAGRKVERRAIQLGLRGDTLRAYAKDEIREVLDVTPLAAEQRPFTVQADWPLLRTPVEDVYVPSDPGIATTIGLDAPIAA
jgi:hypothetical protein